jgi:UDP-glucose 4-epimerase
MSGRRIVVTGLGGELGSLVGSLLEEDSSIGEIVGIDTNPPRRRLKRSAFHLVESSDRARVSTIINDANPHVIIHLGVWEPHARLNTADARLHTEQLGEAVFETAHGLPALESLVLRSGIEVYGSLAYWPHQPNEHQALEPDSEFGHMLLALEHRAAKLAIERGTSIAMLRLASVVGKHVPSPLGRLLRLPAVPFNPFGAPQFSVIQDNDAARAFVAAAKHQPHGAINVVAPGSISIPQAASIGRRITLPTIGPAWWFAKSLSGLAGAPMPDHIVQLLMHGRSAQPGQTEELLNFVPEYSTHEVINSLYEWPSVIRIAPQKQVA